MSPIDLERKRILVLGGSGALGSAIATQLANRGSSVILAGRDAARLRNVATEIGPNTPSVVFDLRVPNHATHVVETATRILGGLDGVINAAGVVAFGPLFDLSDAALDELVAVDLVGPLRVTRAALAHLDKGFLVNITGVVAETPVANLTAYSAVKAGLSAATIALGRELRRQGIHVLDVRPPHTETGLATRAIHGTAPAMPQGLEAADVAATILDALADGRRELEAAAFSRV